MKKWMVRKSSVHNIEDELNTLTDNGYDIYKIDSHPLCDFVIFAKKTKKKKIEQIKDIDTMIG